MGWLDYLLTDDKKLKPEVCLMLNRSNFTHFHHKVCLLFLIPSEKYIKEGVEQKYQSDHELKFKSSSTISVEI